MKICVIKIGATGDVLRTTPILSLYKDSEIFWITSKKNIEILPNHLINLKIFSIENIDMNFISGIDFDLVISLDDDYKCADLASKLKTKKIIGIYLNDGKIIYTKDSSEWFDMGLSSILGKEKADKLKLENNKSYQEIIFNILGYKFNAEKYILPEIELEKNKDKRLIGIENRAGNRWPTKVWNKYDKLEKELKEKGYNVVYFKDKNTLREYVNDISKVSYMICGDTLGMHISIGLNIPTTSIFTCTSPQEIYGYGILKKVVSKNLLDAFYKTEYFFDAVNIISVDEVLETMKDFL